MASAWPSRALVLAVALAVLPLPGCGDEPDPIDSGNLQIAATFEPDPPQVGQNAMHIEVHDLAGLPVDGARVVVDPQMPSMGHGSTEEAVVEALGEGRYDAFPVTLFMPGDWEVTVRATTAEDQGTRAFAVNVR